MDVKPFHDFKKVAESIHTRKKSTVGLQMQIKDQVITSGTRAMSQKGWETAVGLAACLPWSNGSRTRQGQWQ